MTETKKSSDLPASKGMLDETRNELKSDIASLQLEMKSGFQKTDSKIDAVKSEVSQVKSEVSQVKSEINALKSEIKSLNSSVHRMLALYEEQESRVCTHLPRPLLNSNLKHLLRCSSSQ